MFLLCYNKYTGIMRAFLVLFRETKLIPWSHLFMWILHVTCLSPTLTSSKRQHMRVLGVISSNSVSDYCLSKTAGTRNLLWASGHLFGASIRTVGGLFLQMNWLCWKQFPWRVPPNQLALRNDSTSYSWVCCWKIIFGENLQLKGWRNL